MAKILNCILRKKLLSTACLLFPIKVSEMGQLLIDKCRFAGLINLFGYLIIALFYAFPSLNGGMQSDPGSIEISGRAVITLSVELLYNTL